MKNRLRITGFTLLSIGLTIIFVAYMLAPRLGIPELGVMATLIGAPFTLTGLVATSVSFFKK
ncbi:MAG: hypothetical protein ACI9TH_002607 [Kiritimatiellia bacterium]|jgi:hypothetical protein